MQFECLDSFTTWLVKELKPICDAEPAALAKYVLALLRKPDKTEDEIREICTEQLEVFLNGNTKKFINKMFTVMKDNSYMPKKEVEVEVKPMKEKSVTPPPESRKTEQPKKSSRERDDSKTTSSRELKDRDDGKRRTAAASHKEDQQQKRDDSGKGERAPRKRISPPPSEAKRETRDRENREPGRRRSRSPRDRRGRGRRSPEHTRRHVKRSRSRSVERREKRTDDEKRKKRCRDYDEQGFCMRGDLCHYDHGPDPLIVDNENPLDKLVKLPPPTTKTTAATTLNPFSLPPPGYNPLNPPPPGVEAAFPAALPVAAGPVEGYNPEAPALTGANFTVPPPPLPVNMSNAPWRATPYTVPHSSNGMVSAYDGGAGGVPIDPSSAGGPMRSGPMMRGRGRGGHAGGGRYPAQRGDGKTILVKKVPHEDNNIAKLNEHFATFGSVINVQVHYNGEPDAAIVTYANRHEAVAAMKSPAPVLNNRFIRLFWLNDPADSSAHAKTTTTYSASGSLQRSVLNSGVCVEAPIDTPAVVNEPPSKVTTGREAKFVNPAVREAKLKITEAKRNLKELTTTRSNVVRLQEQNLDLMDGLINQQKTILSMLRANKLDAEKKKKVKEMGKDVSQKIIKVKADLDFGVKELSDIAAQVVETEKVIAAHSPALGDDTRVESPPMTSVQEGTVAVVTTEHLMKGDAQEVGHMEDVIGAVKPSGCAIIVSGVKLSQEQQLVQQMQLFGELRDVELLSGNEDSPVFMLTFKQAEDAQMALGSDIKFGGESIQMKLRDSDENIKKESLTATQLSSGIKNECDDE